ncbi:MAG TPA: DUF423 domain-containing protein [Thermoanaerobaculia bacterium]
MAGTWIAAGALCCALSIAAGAFGAHGLRSRLDADALALWETAARYLMYAGLGAALVGLAALHQARRGLDAAAVMLLAGGLVFSGTVAALALGGPRWLGAVTPLGGLLLILGFVVFALAAWRL